MADTQAAQPVETLAQEAEQSETTKTTETPASEQPKVALEVDTDEQDETADTADESDEDEGEKKPKKPSGSARYKAQLAEARAEIERLRRAVPAQADAGEISKAVEARIGPPPKESDYSDYLAFERAQTAYEVDKRQTERVMREEVAQLSQRREAEAVAAFEAHNERVQEVRKVLKDYDKVVAAADFKRLAPDIAKLCVESNKSAVIAYYLASNPKALDELSSMDPISAARRIGRIEASVRLPKPETSSRAPAPPAKLPGGGAPPAETPEKAQSFEEYRRIRLAQLGWK